MTRLGGHRGQVHDAVDELETQSATNLGAGVETGYATATEGLRKGATNRVVLISDGLANTGDTSADSILDRIAHERRDHGITLFGVGVGSDYGDALMEKLADKGDGHTAYVANDADAHKVFVDQLPQNIDLTARDAKAQVAFDPETVAQFRLIGYEDRKVADDDFRNDKVDGGEIGPGHTVTALYAVHQARRRRPPRHRERPLARPEHPRPARGVGPTGDRRPARLPEQRPGHLPSHRRGRLLRRDPPLHRAARQPRPRRTRLPSAHVGEGDGGQGRTPTRRGDRRGTPNGLNPPEPHRLH